MSNERKSLRDQKDLVDSVVLVFIVIAFVWGIAKIIRWILV